MKQEYIEAITKLLPECDRIDILDLVMRLLKKVV